MTKSFGCGLVMSERRVESGEETGRGAAQQTEEDKHPHQGESFYNNLQHFTTLYSTHHTTLANMLTLN